MIRHGRLDHLEHTLTVRRRQTTAPGYRLEQAVAAGADGTWTWDDAHMVFDDHAASLRTYLSQGHQARVIHKERKNGPLEQPSYEVPLWWAVWILSHDLDEHVPDEYPDKLLATVAPPAKWVVDLPDCSFDFDDVVPSAITMIFALGTRTADDFRQKIWTPHHARRKSRPSGCVARTVSSL